MVPLHKLGVQFIYLGSNISSAERNVNLHIGKAWTAIDRLSTTGKSDLFDKIKREFFRAVNVSVLMYGCTNQNLTKHLKEKRSADCARMQRTT